jgi:hypothetical protein
MSQSRDSMNTVDAYQGEKHNPVTWVDAANDVSLDREAGTHDFDGNSRHEPGNRTNKDALVS